MIQRTTPAHQTQKPGQTAPCRGAPSRRRGAPSGVPVATVLSFRHRSPRRGIWGGASCPAGKSREGGALFGGGLGEPPTSIRSASRQGSGRTSRVHPQPPVRRTRNSEGAPRKATRRIQDRSLYWDLRNRERRSWILRRDAQNSDSETTRLCTDALGPWQCP